MEAEDYALARKATAQAQHQCEMTPLSQVGLPLRSGWLLAQSTTGDHLGGKAVNQVLERAQRAVAAPEE